MVVVGVSAGPRVALPVRRRAEGQSFSIASEPSAAAEGTAAAMAAVPVASLLVMQEADSQARQDQEAQSHAESVVDALKELQLALLGARGGDTQRLERLLERPVSAASPRLAAVLSAVRVRAAVELARRRL